MGCSEPTSSASPGANGQPACDLFSETEIEGAWEYKARFTSPDGATHCLVLTLSWSDYQFWVPDGGLAPSRVAEAVLRFIAVHLDRFAGMERIDASGPRRRIPGADGAIAALLGE